MTNVYIKKVKRHDEVWAYIPDWGDGQIKFSRGNRYPGRMYVSFGNAIGDQVWLLEKDVPRAWKLFKKLWEKSALKEKEENR